ncbi:hypothetical protein MGMO_112c00130 [Methyloglobulus morosus KoM1]|uniref:DUF4393 domain-containing protein n=1 Tax=Methyloglobulus morosus KoM1 TaxID=1116472 RepID=V5BTS6_9GAMM|nr:DUF4393 domain-containing protein [Methyloglobulus morosus]ESS71274.1 hypothetical protein MGMO_112c00130 [Methyloglobulus morosus KoM1]
MGLLEEIAQSPAILKEVYGDLAKPGVQQAGKALSTIIGLGNTILWPLALLNERARIALESNLEKYRNKIKHIPIEETCEIPPEVGVPIAEKLSYVTNDELSEMYIELLVKASQAPKANVVHPSFVNIINNISPDEAVLLKSVMHLPGIPFIEVRLQYKEKNEWQTLNSMIPGLFCLTELHYPENVHAYISNLEGLGIFQVRQDIFMVGENIYEPLEEDAKIRYSELIKTVDDKTIVFPRGKIEITPFARLLMDACFVNSVGT